MCYRWSRHPQIRAYHAGFMSIRPPARQFALSDGGTPCSSGPRLLAYIAFFLAIILNWSIK